MHSVLMRQVRLAFHINASTALNVLLQHKTINEVIDLAERMHEIGETAIAAMLLDMTIKPAQRKRAGTAKQHKRTLRPWYPFVINGKLIEKTQYQYEYLAVCLSVISGTVPGILHSVYQKQPTDRTRRKIGLNPHDLYDVAKFRNAGNVRKISGTPYWVGTHASWNINKKYIQYVCQEAGLSCIEQS